ncbi:response regulator transcription factor [Massilia sp. IC2-477]|uniref:response regulator transcription factor n=1 Tax=unclassified Massilia TaxID=2609279 RepID=UPI001D127814|nr:MULTISPECIES: response regulator transcription factor [unclassified Massilia]MCC2955012.1 response regulator transcription factor [Massilia sp. IC2-477]MCC2973006.1 response regulator transcription factor [Massilia sp. IC2-476]
MKIAVLEQDRSQAELICQVLTAAGHTCHAYDSAKECLAQLRKENADMLVMDWNVPDMEGAEILRRAKEKMASNAPTIFLVGNNAEDDIIAGVTAGADDYLVKPLRRGELVARVSALLRRAYPSQNSAEQLQFGPFTFETRPGRLLKDGSIIDVTQKEFSLALLFFRNIGRPLSRAYIHESVWVRDTDVPSRTMDTHVSRVRNKLSLRPENGFRLVPVYSYGYRLEKLGA